MILIFIISDFHFFLKLFDLNKTKILQILVAVFNFIEYYCYSLRNHFHFKNSISNSNNQYAINSLAEIIIGVEVGFTLVAINCGYSVVQPSIIFRNYLLVVVIFNFPLSFNQFLKYFI